MCENGAFEMEHEVVIGINLSAVHSRWSIRQPLSIVHLVRAAQVRFRRDLPYVVLLERRDIVQCMHVNITKREGHRKTAQRGRVSELATGTKRQCAQIVAFVEFQVAFQYNKGIVHTLLLSLRFKKNSSRPGPPHVC